VDFVNILVEKVFKSILGAFAAQKWISFAWPPATGHRATVDIPDCTGCTPLWVACFNNQRDVVNVLLRLGADTTIAGRPEGEGLMSS
jgi:hypothetical protein